MLYHTLYYSFLLSNTISFQVTQNIMMIMTNDEFKICPDFTQLPRPLFLNAASPSAHIPPLRSIPLLQVNSWDVAVLGMGTPREGECMSSDVQHTETLPLCVAVTK